MVLSRELAKICYASLLLVTSAICNAADSSQFYAGGNLAYSKARYENSQLVSDLASGGITATGTVDNTATGGKIFAGYKLVDLFAIEVGYFDLGTVLTDTGSYSRPTPASTFSGSTKIRGESIDLVWTIPVGKGFSALARLGERVGEGLAEDARPDSPEPRRAELVHRRAGLAVGMSVQQKETDGPGAGRELPAAYQAAGERHVGLQIGRAHV